MFTNGQYVILTDDNIGDIYLIDSNYQTFTKNYEQKIEEVIDKDPKGFDTKYFGIPIIQLYVDGEDSLKYGYLSFKDKPLVPDDYMMLTPIKFLGLIIKKLIVLQDELLTDIQIFPEGSKLDNISFFSINNIFT